MVSVRNTTSADAVELACHMRGLDRQELWSSDRQTPAEALRIAIETSEVCRTLLIDGEVAAMFGVREMRPDVGLIWMLTSSTVDRKPFAFWRTMRTELLQLLRVYPALANMVDARYTQAVESLRRVGFTIHPSEPYGADALPFHFCIIRRFGNASRTGASAQGGRGEARKERQAEEAKGRYLERGARPIRVWHPQKARLEAAT
jgi:hypothetical protein